MKRFWVPYKKKFSIGTHLNNFATSLKAKSYSAYHYIFLLSFNDRLG